MDIVHHHFNKLDSTNNCAKRNAHLFEKPKLSLISADEQLAGRGRTKRHWLSPQNQNIYATFCFFIDPKRKDIGNLSQVMAISAVQVLRNHGVSPQLKWPNDIQINGKKISGVLCEMVEVEDSFCFLCGIGLNVNMSDSELEKIDIPATSILAETDQVSDPQAILKELQNAFHVNLIKFLENGFEPFRDTLKTLMSHALNKEIRFHDNTKLLKGVLDSINEDGSLTLKLANNEKKVFSAGKILEEGKASKK